MAGATLFSKGGVNGRWNELQRHIKGGSHSKSGIFSVLKKKQELHQMRVGEALKHQHKADGGGQGQGSLTLSLDDAAFSQGVRIRDVDTLAITAEEEVAHLEALITKYALRANLPRKGNPNPSALPPLQRGNTENTCSVLGSEPEIDTELHNELHAFVKRRLATAEPLPQRRGGPMAVGSGGRSKKPSSKVRFRSVSSLERPPWGGGDGDGVMSLLQASCLMRIYHHLDANQSGGVTKRELFEAFVSSHAQIETQFRSSVSELDEAESYMQAMDGNHDGQVSAEEWMAFWETMGGAGDGLDSLIQAMGADTGTSLDDLPWGLGKKRPASLEQLARTNTL